MKQPMLASIDLFLQHLMVDKGLTQKTIRDCRIQLCLLFQFIEERGYTQWGQLNYEDLMYYVKLNVAVTSRASTIRFLKTFFTFLYQNRLLEKALNYETY
ncbi:site-specific integrase [Ammoniphilus sp. CFH 90114]|uniref:site-specific integrase n=1 Tax=Ammoniphilus sp. CFH 90114 TaxID=2493665 RepID=UPI0013E8F846|nr:site-specific integrase [Ammoniphilus sp. CFH 90114]